MSSLILNLFSVLKTLIVVVSMIVGCPLANPTMPWVKSVDQSEAEVVRVVSRKQWGP